MSFPFTLFQSRLFDDKATEQLQMRLRSQRAGMEDDWIEENCSVKDSEQSECTLGQLAEAGH